MNIQSNVNQILALSSYLLAHSPMAEARKENIKLSKAADVEKMKYGRFKEGLEADITGQEAAGKDVTAARTEADKAISERARKAYESTGDPYYLEETSAASKRAEAALKVKQGEKRKARRSFIDYMRNEPTSFGVTVGELTPELRKTVLSEYSKKERKQIMDRKDAAK
jgi:hypothetical protein